jgi:PPM family protein phosphatase
VSLLLRYAARSDVGLVRSNNEDSVYAGARLLALADGMGGHAAGEVASQLAIAALAHLDDDEPGGDLLGKLDAAVRAGNSAIAGQVELDPELEGMGTTLTAILFAGNRIGLVHIGDSRGYLLRDGELTQITKDDTFVQTLVDEGRITREEAHSHPQRSLIMRALTGHEVEPTLIMREARAGDRYLLCSDGLSDPVSDETIRDALQIPDVSESAERLIELALRGGGPDNVTVVVADVVDNDYGQTQPILAGAVSGDVTQQTRPNTAAGRASAINARKTVPPEPVAPAPETATGPKYSRRRLAIGIASVVLLLLAGLAIGRTVVRGYYYVADYNDTVTIMRGIRGTILGIALQEPWLVGCFNGSNEPYGQVGKPPGCQPLRMANLSQSSQELVKTGLPYADLDGAKKQLQGLFPACPPASSPFPATPPSRSQTPAPTNSAAPSTSAPPSAPASAPPSASAESPHANVPAIPPTPAPSRATGPNAPASPPSSNQPALACREAA